MKNIIEEEYVHIDNGGVIVSIIDNDAQGIVLKIETSYYGYPAVSSQIRIDNYADRNLGSKWLDSVGHMFLRASKKVAEMENKML